VAKVAPRSDAAFNPRFSIFDDVASGSACSCPRLRRLHDCGALATGSGGTIDQNIVDNEVPQASLTA